MKKHIFHLAWSPESLPTVDAISPLLGFLDSRLQELNVRLLKGNIIRCLHIMWESVLHEIDDHVESNISGVPYKINI
jgi:BAI1-associated protein 3